MKIDHVITAPHLIEAIDEEKWPNCYETNSMCAAPKGHFLSPDSLAKGVFLANIP